MNCREFEIRLDEIAAATAGAAMLREAAAHALTCARCRDLETMARASFAGAAAGPIPDLTARVLSLTSGPACGAACDRLGDFVDANLAGPERELVDAHLRGCPSCEALFAAMARISSELPSLAEIDPGAEFTAAVMRATSGAPALLRRRPGPLAAARAWWPALTSRPRFALEAAYAGALALWLLFGAGFSPFGAVPATALELARTNPVRVIEDTVRPASLGRNVWEATAAPVLQRAEASTEALSSHGVRLRSGTGSLARHGAAAIGSAFRGDLSGSAARLKEMSDDLRLLWDGLRGKEVTKKTNAQEA